LSSAGRASTATIALPERRKAVAELLASLALTAFLTGITRPIEFSFMFLTPLLLRCMRCWAGLWIALLWRVPVRDHSVRSENPGP
jgi:PTS system N-acetylglucosamine-specific IIC component